MGDLDIKRRILAKKTDAELVEMLKGHNRFPKETRVVVEGLLAERGVTTRSADAPLSRDKPQDDTVSGAWEALVKNDFDLALQRAQGRRITLFSTHSDEFEKVLSRDGIRPDWEYECDRLWLIMAASLMELDRFAEAESLLAKMPTEKQSQLWALAARQLSGDDGPPDLVSSWLDRCLTLDPSNDEALVRKAIICEAAGKPKEAKDYYRRISGSSLLLTFLFKDPGTALKIMWKQL